MVSCYQRENGELEGHEMNGSDEDDEDMDDDVLINVIRQRMDVG
jgi:hypothetical protein